MSGRSRGICVGALLAATAVFFLPSAAHAQALERIRSAGAVKLGYDPEARPFSFKGDGDNAAGYSVALCTKVADELKGELERTELVIEWVPLKKDAAYQAVRDGSIDLFCGAEPVTLTRRKEVSFSIPIFPSGTGAVLSASAPSALREVLAYGQPSERPIWRGSPARTLLENKTFSPIAGTTSEGWLSERIKTFQLSATVVPVATYDQGIESVLSGSSNVVFGDLPLLLDAAARSQSSGNLIVLERHFTYEPLGLVLGRNDEDFRLVVDKALSGAYRSEDFREFFTEWFGPPDEAIVTFFRQTALPE
ncbi:amino acid ABC transporter substrate-binding protein [Bradyrhizobium sp. BRP14]|nr:amino acid ABC transporter substrate-binding protein [Bradyrhizobium sp. BRP14]